MAALATALPSLSQVTSKQRILAGRYRVDELLVEGGMGMLYRGYHLDLNMPVAIKFVRAEYAQMTK